MKDPIAALNLALRRWKQVIKQRDRRGFHQTRGFVFHHFQVVGFGASCRGVVLAL